jgi:alpha-ketoglutarate-dependent taurine dioxygenase
MRAAYDALPATTRARIENLSAYHSIRRSQAAIGHEVKAGESYGMSDDEPPLRPLVKIHPVTGRKSLYIGRHAFDIPGLSQEESKQLMAELTQFACQPPRVYTHHWQVGDVALWDNRCLLHRARPFDTREVRVLWHVRVKGDPTTERALNK